MPSTDAMRVAHKIDIDAVRAATPGCHEFTFLDNAGAALATQHTLDATIGHLLHEARVGGYRAGADVAEVLQAGRTQAATLLNANGPDEIAFVPSDGAGFTKVFWGLLLGNQIVQGDRVLVDRINYSSHYLALLQARDQFDLRIDVIPSLVDGSIDLDGLDRMLGDDLDQDVALVSTTMIGTHCGLVNPVAAVGARCRDRGILYIVDACQAVGQMPVDVQAIGCDALTTTGRKWLRAPRGTGLLWVHRDVIPVCVPIGIDGGSASWLDEDRYELARGAKRFEEFETSVAAQVGLAAALDQVNELGIAAIHHRITSLADGLRAALKSVPGVSMLDGEGERSGIVTFTIEGHEPSQVAAALSEQCIVVSASDAPWARLDMDAKGFTAVVRASPHYYNTADELDRLVEAIGRWA